MHAYTHTKQVIRSNHTHNILLVCIGTSSSEQTEKEWIHSFAFLLHKRISVPRHSYSMVSTAKFNKNLSHASKLFFPSPFEAGSSQSERERERLLLPGVGRAIMVVCIIHSEGKRRPLFPDFSTWVPFRLYRSLRFFSSPSPSSSFSSSSASLDTQSSTYRIFCHY